MTIHITPEIIKAHEAYLDEVVDAFFNGVPIMRRTTMGADHFSLVHFAAGYQAGRKQMAEEAAAVCEDYASRAKSTGEMFHQGTERRVGWEAKQEAGKTLSVRFKALCRSLATPTEGKTASIQPQDASDARKQALMEVEKVLTALLINDAEEPSVYDIGIQDALSAVRSLLPKEE
jgi:hypothetical protein